jgi:hypothetical protein
VSLTANAASVSAEYHPTRERFMELAGSIRFALEASQEEWDEAGDGPWQEYDREALIRELRPESELEALWAQPDTQALWVRHQAEFLAQANLTMMRERAEPEARSVIDREILSTWRRLDQIREAIWNDPAYVALYRLSKELR